MSEKKLTSPKLQKWREWMKAIEPEIRLLLRDAERSGRSESLSMDINVPKVFTTATLSVRILRMR